jgi:hypothetical protein
MYLERSKSTSSMEFAVYDGPNRRASLLVGVAPIVGMLAAFGTFFVIRHGETTVPPPGSYLILFPLTMILALFPLIETRFSCCSSGCQRREQRSDYWLGCDLQNPVNYRVGQPVRVPDTIWYSTL